jgi:hypothetical protein
MMATPQIELSYTIHPPSQCKALDIPTQAEQSISIEIPPNPSNTTQTQVYYTATSNAVLQVQKDLNDILTGWKDAIGDLEKDKEDMGVVGFGQGRASRMMSKESEVVNEADSDEDGVELADV